jgi:transcriptional regulator of aromatic amino acid metabolism
MSEKITQQNLELKDLNMKLEVIVRERTRVLQITQQIVERLPVAVLGLGEDGMITLANQKARQLISGYNENIIGQDIWELLSEDTIIKFNKIGDMEGKPVKMNLSEKILLLEIIRVSESGGFLGFVYVDSIVNDWNNETSPYPLLVSENE